MKLGAEPLDRHCTGGVEGVGAEDVLENLEVGSDGEDQAEQVPFELLEP